MDSVLTKLPIKLLWRDAAKLF